MIPPQTRYQLGPCRIAFVGEAPAEEEVLEGLPLVGTAGRLFAQLLRTAGLATPMPENGRLPADFYPTMASRGLRPLLWERSQYHITNVFNERLPDNDVKNWCAPATEKAQWDDYKLDRIEGSGFLRPEHLGHLQRLQTELQAVKPTLIVPMGSTALWAFTGNSEIGASRGAIGIAKYITPGVKILPTFHPIGVVHQYKMFPVVVADLVKAARESEFAELRLPKRSIWIEPTLEDLKTFEKKFIAKAKGPISIDIETAGGQITCIGFAPTSETAIVVPFVDYRKPNRSYWGSAKEEYAAWEWVAKICGSRKPKLLQNGQFDCYFLLMLLGIKVRNFKYDTRLVHHALFPELQKSLGFMGSMYTNQTAWKLMRGKRSDKRDE